MNIIKSYCLYLNSREANNGTPDNCNFLLTTPLTLTNMSNRFVISTPMIELPYSFSQVNSSNNNLTYNYVDNTGGGHTYTSTMTIPSGNYNINALQTQLATSLITDIYLRIPSSTLTINNFSFSYNQQTSLGTYYMVGVAFAVSITLQFSTAYALGLMFGFPQVNQTFGTSVKLTSVNKVMVNPITSVYLRSDTFKFQNNYEAIVQTWANSDIVAKIPINTLPNSIIYYRNDVKSIVNNTNISTINLYLSDNLDTTYSISMNGVNYGIMLQIDEIEYKVTNAFKDKVEFSNITSAPIELIEQRDEIMKDLILKKEKLEKEIEEKKKKKAEKKLTENQTEP